MQVSTTCSPLRKVSSTCSSVGLQTWEYKLLSQIEENRQRELAEALRMMGNLDERRKQIVSNLASSLIEKTFMPLIESFHHAEETNDMELTEVAKKLLKLK